MRWIVARSCKYIHLYMQRMLRYYSCNNRSLTPIAAKLVSSLETQSSSKLPTRSLTTRGALRWEHLKIQRTPHVGVAVVEVLKCREA